MPRTGRPPVPPEIRFFNYVDQQGECWVWTGTKNRGYGHFWHGSGRVYAHRWAYQYFVAPIPHGLTIDHLCNNRACVNPEHLDPVPQRVNTLRAESPPSQFARAMTCAHGHPLEQEGERRRCRTCRREAQRRYRQRSRAA